jgi:hypothetical protein
MVSNILPTEYQEALALVDYLRLKNITFCHINNEVYTKSWNQKRKQTAQGTARGFPDYFMIINNKPYCIELKRTKGGVVSKFQKEWIEKLNNAGVETIIAKGAKEAIDFINNKIIKCKS